MTADERPLVRGEVTYKVHVVHEVTAKVEAHTTVLRSDVADWMEKAPEDVTHEDVMAYVAEGGEDEEALIDESLFELRSIEDWDSPEVTVLTEERVSIAPPTFVPLFEVP
ncbi:hypothetical protein QDA01_gp87 [Microbacterium phage Cinna]|uniref:Uncharacterized protein n=1 Tax=Microbacterium phage Cinna TaxID=2591215 RepID=A0A514DDB5_9CAUD|nr:hypothetical protein QDA01_gp87 [Microbacterium phage Cinna]QDH91602.1 hypothetical protein PBI_CINNA_18 [Microbacterium phage Cinna]